MFKTDPFDMDTDGDGIPDGEEAASGSDPANPDDPNPRCRTVGVELYMPAYHYSPGNPCFLKAVICNSYSVPIPELKFFAVLDAYGTYFYAPGWTKTLDYWSIQADPGPREQTIIPQFTWPEGVGTADGLLFYGVLTDSGIKRIIGEFSTWEFGWSE